MKQKQNKAAANGAKANKKPAPPKKVQEPVEENAEEEQEVVAKKPMNKRAAKNQKQVVKEEKAVVPNKKAAKKKAPIVPEVKEEPEEEEEQEDPEEMIQEEQEVDEEEQEDESDEDDEQEDEEMDGEEEGDEEPTIPSQIKSGEIDKSVECSKIIHITKLPKKCNQTDIVEAFAKYGAIEQIHIFETPGGAVANVAFKTEKAAQAALADNKTIKIGDSLVKVTLKREKTKKTPKDDSVYISHLKVGTTEEQIREHFAACGEIVKATVVCKDKVAFAFVSFKEKSSVESALKLHNSILNELNIKVFRNGTDNNTLDWGERYDDKRTIKIANKQKFKNIDSKKIESIFSKCGEIELLDILCTKSILALLKFKNEDAAQKALKLNGKKMQDIELELELYDPHFKNAIFVTNLHKDCTDEDLETCFSKAGEIVSIFRNKPNCATIRFKTSESYCKSFLYNESIIKGSYIFIEPFSQRKHALVLKMKSIHSHPGKGFKRKGGKQNGYDSAFRPKKWKK